MTDFRAFRIHTQDKGVAADFETMSVNDLTEGDVVIKVMWSDINYKDALAATGAGKILRKPVLNGGIDLSGVVEQSSDDRFKVGDSVLVVGCGLSEVHDGGYAEYARVPGDCVVRLPQGLSLRDAMAIGTAGFTAALAVIRMEQLGQTPDHGPVLVTGSTGGVGSFAIDMLAGRGYDCHALTGKGHQHDYLKDLGAGACVDRHSLEMGTRPMEKAQWGGAVDNVGGETLGWLTRTVVPFGNIASIGLAGGIKLETTVMPFILRGVSVIGINSIEMPSSMRDNAWSRLASDLKPRHIDKIVTKEVLFDDLPNSFDGYLTGDVTGRAVVKINA